MQLPLELVIMECQSFVIFWRKGTRNHVGSKALGRHRKKSRDSQQVVGRSLPRQPIQDDASLCGTFRPQGAP